MSKLIDLTGQRFGRLTVLCKDANRITNSGSYWICRCDCGNVKSIRSSALRRGEIQSCGCLRDEKIQKVGQQHFDDLTGRRFGYLTVLKKDEKRSGEKIYWICQCDCGNICSVSAVQLRKKDVNRTVSCGCHHRSIGENNIISILEENNIPYISQYIFTDLPRSRFDFALLNKENKIIRLIEFDGEQHFQDVPAWGGLELQQRRDKEKNEYAIAHNIPLVRIPYWERDSMTLDMLLGDEYLIEGFKRN